MASVPRQLSLDLIPFADPVASADLQQSPQQIPQQNPPTETHPAVDGLVPERRIFLSGEPCAYRLRRARRRTIGFQIDDRGLTVSAPRWVSLREIETAIVDKERWIRTRLDRWRQWRARRNLPQVRFCDGGTLPYLGAQITLRLRGDLRASVLVPGSGDVSGFRSGSEPGSEPAIANPAAAELRLALPPQATEAQIRDAVQTWLKNEAQQVLGSRLHELAARNGVAYASWTLSSARTRWGSCCADGRIRLNWRLIHFSLSMIDYVVAHELAHRKELNHGPEFWRQVGRLLPGFETARDQIRNEDLSALPF